MNMSEDQFRRLVEASKRGVEVNSQLQDIKENILRYVPEGALEARIVDWDVENTESGVHLINIRFSYKMPLRGIEPFWARLRDAYRNLCNLER